MPTCRRKRVVLTEPSQALLQAAKSNSDKDVYYLQQTGEIFETYEYVLQARHPRSGLTIPVRPRAYAARMSFYRLKQFQCEVTGKSGLDYFQALESEQQEAQTMHSRFPEPLKPAVLKAVQWRTSPFFPRPPSPSAHHNYTEVVGRLDHLVEAVFDRFKDRYFPDESMPCFVRSYILGLTLIFLMNPRGLCGRPRGQVSTFRRSASRRLMLVRFYARVLQVYPPRHDPDSTDDTPENQASSSTLPLPATPDEKVQIHKIGGDLKIPAKESVARDDPLRYSYKVQILDEQHDRSHEKGKLSLKEKVKWSGSLMDVQCTAMRSVLVAFTSYLVLLLV